MSKKEDTDEALSALDVTAESSTRTIRAQFRRKAKALQSGRSENPTSKKTFQELNEAYQLLIQNRANHQSLPTKTVTIISSDVAEYSRLMSENEQDTVEFFNLCKDVFEEIVEKNQGRIFNTAGDAILAEFDHVFNAVTSAVEIQKEIRAINLGQPEGRKVLFRMGLNHGEVFMQEGDLLGDAVNIAARIQTASKPGGICISGNIYDLVANKISHSLTPLGKLNFKNIPEPIRTYALTEDDGKFKPPLPDAKIAPFEAQPRLKKSSRSEKKTETSNGARNALLLAMALGAGGFFFWNSKSTTNTTQTKVAATNEVAPSQVFLAPTPDSQVTLMMADRTLFQGSTPAQLEAKPGLYKVRIENKELGISEEEDLLVEPGKSAKFLKILVAKKAAAMAGEAGSLSASSDSGGPLTQLEIDLKQSADQNKDPEPAYRFGMASAKRGNFDVAYIYFTNAAASKHGPAQFELGKLFFFRKGTPQTELSFDVSLYWLLRAAMEGVKDATAFLAENKNRFPQEFSRNIENQRRIDTGDPRTGKLRDEQLLFLDDLKQKLKDARVIN